MLGPQATVLVLGCQPRPTAVAAWSSDDLQALKVQPRLVLVKWGCCPLPASYWHTVLNVMENHSAVHDAD